MRRLPRLPGRGSPERRYRDDLDIGTFTTVLLPNEFAFHVGKAGTAYLLDGARLGHSYPSGTLGAQLFSSALCTRGGYAAAAWSPPNLYVPCKEGLKRLLV